MPKASKAKVDPASIVSAIASTIQPPRSGYTSWWQRIDNAETQSVVDAIHESWHRGVFGRARTTAARAISAKLQEFGITVGEGAVVAWLRLPPKS